MDPGRIISVKLTQDKIREIAEEFRSEYIFNKSLPVDIEHVIEVTMGIIIIPMKGLQKTCDMEGFISKDFKKIYVDEELYMDERYYKRVRFTIAHEIGHLLLHRSNIDGLKFESETDWIKFRMGMNDETLGWFETQASEIAGRILVPFDQLVESFKEARTSIMKTQTSWDSQKLDDEELFSLVAQMICKKFDVSSGVIERRLRKENVMGLIGK
jgi:Zn-dependent peptidase ImmA (M78 family)